MCKFSNNLVIHVVTNTISGTNSIDAYWPLYNEANSRTESFSVTRGGNSSLGLSHLM